MVYLVDNSDVDEEDVAPPAAIANVDVDVNVDDDDDDDDDDPSTLVLLLEHSFFFSSSVSCVLATTGAFDRTSKSCSLRCQTWCTGAYWFHCSFAFVLVLMTCANNGKICSDGPKRSIILSRSTLRIVVFNEFIDVKFTLNNVADLFRDASKAVRVKPTENEVPTNTMAHASCIQSFAASHS